MFSNKKTGKFLSRFLFSYIVLLGISLIVSYSIYRQSIKTMEKYEMENNLSSLEHSRDILDQRLAEINMMVQQLAKNPKVESMLYRSAEEIDTDIYNKYDTFREVSVYLNTNSFISNFYIVMFKNNMVLSPTNTYKLPFFYNNFYTYGTTGYEQWYGDLKDGYHYHEIKPVTPTMINDVAKPVLTYTQSIPLDNPNAPLGAIIVLIDAQEIKNIFQTVHLNNGEYLAAADPNGNILSDWNKAGKDMDGIQKHLNEARGYAEEVLDGEKMLVSYTTSIKSGWFFISAVPYDTVMKRLDNIKMTVLIFIIIWLIVGVAVSYILAYWNSRPIKKIIRSVRARFPGNITSSDEYTFLSRAIDSLLENDATLRSAMERQLPVLQSLFLERLLRGSFFSMEEINTNMHEYKLDISGSCFAVLLVLVDGYSGLISEDSIGKTNKARYIVSHTLQKKFETTNAVDIDEDKVAFILACKEKDSYKCRNWMENLVSEAAAEIREGYNIYPAFAAGKLYNELTDLFYSFREALQALHQRNFTPYGTLIHYKRVEENRNHLFYPLEIETRIMNVLKAGDLNGLEKVLEIVYAENFNKRELPEEMAYLLLNNMKCTVLKVIDQIPDYHASPIAQVHDMLHEIALCKSSRDMTTGLTGIFRFLCTRVSVQKQGNKAQLKELVLKYIDSHCLQTDFSLYKTADEFNLTEEYLSLFFKEQTGINFSDHVEKLRMEAACHMLLKENPNIENIASSVGFSSASGFRRAFKRVIGVNPTTYRNMQK